MNNLKIYNIASINVKTQGHNFKRKNFFIGERNVRILADFIQNEELYSVGTQELTYLHQQRLAKLLFLNYVVSGSYRFGNGKILEKIPFNESNAIVTKSRDIATVYSETNHIPSFPTVKDFWRTGLTAVTKLQPRIITMAIDEKEKMIHVNTHLHDAFHEKRKKQEKYIWSYVKSVSQEYPGYGIVLTGDFNDYIDNSYFSNFVENMETIGFNRVPIDERTFCSQKEDVAIEHIFISERLELQDFKVCDTGSITTTTDHYPIIAKVKKR